MAEELLAMRPATPSELARDENIAKRTLDAWIHAFVNFPTKGNLDGVVDRMTAYQQAWMNGRERPES